MSFSNGQQSQPEKTEPRVETPQPSSPPPTQTATPNPEQRNQTQRRYMDCHTPTAFGIPGLHHRYMFDNDSGEQYGKGDQIEEHEDGSHTNRTVRPGPYGGTDSCAFIQAELERAQRAYAAQQQAVRQESQLPAGLPGMEGKRSWAPFVQDCHQMQDESLSGEGIKPGGTRIGRMPQGVTEEEARKAREESLKQQKKTGGDKF